MMSEDFGPCHISPAPHRPVNYSTVQYLVGVQIELLSQFGQRLLAP